MCLDFEILTSASHTRSVAKFQYEHYVLEIYTSIRAADLLTRLQI